MTRLTNKTVLSVPPLVAVAALAMGYQAQRAQANPRPQTPGLTLSKLVGTWRVTTVKYGKMPRFVPFSKTRIMLKHITPAGFTMVTYDIKTGTVTRVAGGTYTVQGNTYEENIQYGMGADILGLIGKSQRFNDEVTATQWHHRGRLSQGEPIEEYWTRVP